MKNKIKSRKVYLALRDYTDKINLNLKTGLPVDVILYELRKNLVFEGINLSRSVRDRTIFSCKTLIFL